MTLTRRQFAIACASTAGSLTMPFGAQGAAAFDTACMEINLRGAVKRLVAEHRNFALAELNYEHEGLPFSGIVNWHERYELLLDAHEQVHEAVADDVGTDNRSVVAWANSLVPCPGRQAIEFWKPISGLSDTFSGLQSEMFEALGRYAETTWAFSTRFPMSYFLLEEELDVYSGLVSARERAADAWFRLRERAQYTWAEQPNDTALHRKIAQRHMTEVTIEIPYLQRVVSDWRPYEDWPLLRRCPVACVDCDRLQLPIVATT